MMNNPRRVKSHWLGLLLKTRFFLLCDDHRDLRKSETNIYCIECGESMCHHCLSSPRGHHGGHHLLQIRRYVYQDVIRVHDMQKYVDCSKVQSFIVNGAKVVLLNPKKQSKPVIAGNGGGGALCGICQRAVPEPNRYCSIACKTSHVGSGSGFPESEPFLSSPNSDLDNLTCPTEEGDSSSTVTSTRPSDSIAWVHHNCSEEEPPRRKRANRRKGVPRRARFF